MGWRSEARLCPPSSSMGEKNVKSKLLFHFILRWIPPNFRSFFEKSPVPMNGKGADTRFLIFCICFHKSGYSKPFNDFPLLRTKIPNLKYIQKVLSSLVPVSLHFQVYIVLFFSLVSSWFLPWPVLQVLKSTSYTFLFTIPSIIHLSICS